MERIGMMLILLLASILDDRPPTGLERATTPPNVVTVALRLPLVKKGMTETEVSSTLGVDNYLLRLGGGTLQTRFVSYQVRPGFRLNEVYHLDPKSSQFVLESATLHRETAHVSAR